jgi:hypothetical protein
VDQRVELHLECFLGVCAGGHLQGVVGGVVEGPGAADGHPEGSAVLEDGLHSGPGVLLHRLRHEPVRVPPVHVKRLPAQHEALAFSAHHSIVAVDLPDHLPSFVPLDQRCQTKATNYAHYTKPPEVYTHHDGSNWNLAHHTIDRMPKETQEGDCSPPVCTLSICLVIVALNCLYPIERWVESATNSRVGKSIARQIRTCFLESWLLHRRQDYGREIFSMEQVSTGDDVQARLKLLPWYACSTLPHPSLES